MSNQTICFGNESDLKKGYKSVSFPIAHNGVVYGNTSVNLASAFFGRTLVERCADGADNVMFAGYDSWLRDNQKSFISQYRHHFLEYAREFSFREGICIDANWENMIYSLFPHIKRSLRKKAARDVFITGKWLDKEWNIFMKRFKLKLYETAKFGKRPRGIGDLGVAESLRGAEITEAIKSFMSNTVFTYGTSSCTFVKTVSHDNLKMVFDAMVPHADKYRVDSYVFSDDSLVSISYLGGGKYHHKVYAIDISKCDVSHIRELFELFRDMFESHGLIQILMDQCIGDICLFGLDRARKIIVELLDYTLLSGSTLTTALNTLANYMIFLCICIYKPTDGHAIMKAVEQCGYVVTTGEDLAGEPSQFEFLKHWPVLTTSGEYEPTLALGPFFRRFGTSTDSEFPGSSKMSIRDRAFAHESAVINGMFGDGITCGVSNPFIDMMRRVFRVDVDVKHAKELQKVSEHHAEYKVMSDFKLIKVSDEELFKRYFVSSSLNGDSVTMDDVSDLYREIENVTYGRNVESRMLFEILRKDYGLGRC